ncbi:MAG: UDP-phosphate galactose phosphotransferase [bacterium]|nr:MAG: UDP-phosphate galactose phosphotransferase [bacterium]
MQAVEEESRIAEHDTVFPVASGHTSWSESPLLPRLWRYSKTMLLLLDTVTIFCAFMLAYYARFYIDFIPSGRDFVGDAQSYMNSAAVLTMIWVFLIWRDGGYENGLHGAGAPRFRILIRSGFYAVAGLMVISFLYRELLLSRMVYLTSGLFAATGMLCLRFMFISVDRNLAEKGVIVRRVAIAGANGSSRELVERMKGKWSTAKVIGYINCNGLVDIEVPTGEKLLGWLNEVREIYEKSPFDILIITSPEQVQHQCSEYNDTVMEVINFCEEKNVAIHMLTGSFNVAVTQSEIGSFSGMPLLKLQDASVHPIYITIKRITDICISVAVMLVGLPAWLLIALLIRLTGEGPVLFTQTRAGFHGKPFKMYKFRSMAVDAESRLKELVDIDNLDQPVFKIKDDPRVTAIGRFLRRTSLDEIPQLLNVLKGDMSIVGPRPEELVIVKKYNQWQRRRLKAKPGLTGFQQIKNRGEPDLAQRIKYDLIYLKQQNLSQDFYIMARTVWVVLRGNGTTH